jgi:nitrous oxidase accessory protein
MKTFSLTLLSLVVETVLISTGYSAASVHTVAQGESITSAILRAEPGDTIQLTGGEYRENIVVDKRLTLTGADLPVIRGGYQGNVVHVTAAGTVVRGVKISEAGPHLTKDMACVLVEADDVTVQDCVITESLHDIYIKAGQRARIAGNRIEGRLDLIEADRGNGIHLNWSMSRRGSICQIS